MRCSHILALMASTSVFVMAAPAFAADAPSTVQEVIVTANKRAEAAKDVPMSITALGGDQLQEVQAHSFTDYAKLVPGLDLEAIAPGESRVTLRGLNAGGVASTVAAYMDETPMGSSSGLVDGAIFTTDFDTYDMQRIEVLRGPQGTLYGANTEGGLIKFVTNAPSMAGFAGSVDGRVENVAHGQTGGAVDAMLNVPISSTLAVRLTGFHDVLEGYINDPGPSPLLSESAVNRGTKDGLRASFLWKPSDVFSLRLTGMSQDMKLQGSSQEDVNAVTLAPTGGDLNQQRYLREPRSFHYRNVNLTLNYDMGWATLTSATSYGQVNITSLSDTTAALGAPSGEVQTTDDWKATEELRLSSPKSDHLEWLLGVYWTTEEGGIHQDIGLIAPPAQPFAIDQFEFATIDSKYSEQAIFGDLTYHFSKQFDVQIGGRYGNIVQNGKELITGVAFGGAVFTTSTNEGEHVSTYSIAPRWHVTDNTLLYVRVASGFRPGGPNVFPVNPPPGTPFTYAPDTTTSYEGGVKTTLLDGALSVDAAVFLTDWHSIQVFEVINKTGVNGNAGNARSQGFEWDATWRPMQGLTLLWTGAYTDAKLTSEPPPAAFLLFAHNGAELPWVPKWSTALDGEYRWPALSNGDAFVGGTVAYTGDRMSDFGDPSRLRLSSYTTLDLRGGIDLHKWRLEVFGKNLGDKRAVTALGGVGGTFAGGRSAAVLQPRTIGVEASAKF